MNTLLKRNRVFIALMTLVLLSGLSGVGQSFAENKTSESEAVAKTQESESEMPVYRFWSDYYQGHFYTLSEQEKGAVIQNYPDNIWKYEKIAFSAQQYQGSCGSGLSPVYRFWSELYKSHFYTISAVEKDYIQSHYPTTTWKYELISYCTRTTTAEDYKPVYRFWSDAYRTHFYTASGWEKDNIINTFPSNVWKYEFISFYVKDDYSDLLVDPVGPNCPVSSQNCVPCVSGDQYCRIETGKTSGFKGWSCQNNNPGNIRYSSYRNSLIVDEGGEAACGERASFMVFRDYWIGRDGLKKYITAISKTKHTAYPECGNCSLRYFFSIYAPAGDQNDPNSYSAFVANYIGVDVDNTTLTWIVANKLDLMADAIQIKEGWFVQ